MCVGKAGLPLRAGRFAPIARAVKPSSAIERGILKYLTSSAGARFRQVLLIDGPAVLGWEKWREVDARYFGGTMQGPMKNRLQKHASAAREIEAIGHLLAGAVSEAALVCAASEHRTRDARELTSALLKMLAPFFR